MTEPLCSRATRVFGEPTLRRPAWNVPFLASCQRCEKCEKPAVSRGLQDWRKAARPVCQEALRPPQRHPSSRPTAHTQATEGSDCSFIDASMSSHTEN